MTTRYASFPSSHTQSLGPCLFLALFLGSSRLLPPSHHFSRSPGAPSRSSSHPLSRVKSLPEARGRKCHEKLSRSRAALHCTSFIARVLFAPTCQLSRVFVAPQVVCKFRAPPPPPPRWHAYPRSVITARIRTKGRIWCTVLFNDDARRIVDDDVHRRRRRRQPLPRRSAR